MSKRSTSVARRRGEHEPGRTADRLDPGKGDDDLVGHRVEPGPEEGQPQAPAFPSDLRDPAQVKGRVGREHAHLGGVRPHPQPGGDADGLGRAADREQQGAGQSDRPDPRTAHGSLPGRRRRRASGSAAGRSLRARSYPLAEDLGHRRSSRRRWTSNSPGQLPLDSVRGDLERRGCPARLRIRGVTAEKAAELIPGRGAEADPGDRLLHGGAVALAEQVALEEEDDAPVVGGADEPPHPLPVLEEGPAEGVVAEGGGRPPAGSPPPGPGAGDRRGRRRGASR